MNAIGTRSGVTPAGWAAVALAAVALAASLADGTLLELQRGGAWWRIVTCHFTHFTHEQLAWDAIALLALCVACARRNRAAFHATLLASIVIIPIAVLAFAPDVTAYRGLSGIDSALFALLLMLEARRSRVVMLCAIGFVAKLAFELTTGSAVFAGDMGGGVVPVPVAHLAGALTAVMVMTLRTKALVLAPLLFASCMSVRTPPPLFIARSCAPRELAGTWQEFRTTQLGPAWVRLSFGCDCRWVTHIQLLWAHFRVEGRYLREGDRVRMTDEQEPVPMAVDGDRLVMIERGERHVYTRVRCASCSPCS